MYNTQDLLVRSYLMTFLVYKHISWNIYQTFSTRTEIKVKYFCDIMSVNIKTYAQKSCLNVKMRYRESLKIISLTFTSRLLLHCLTFCYEKDTVIYITRQRKNHIYCVNIWGTYTYYITSWSKSQWYQIIPVLILVH